MNKKLAQVFLTILAAAAMVQCGAPVASEGTCRGGICVNLELLEPIRLDAPVTVVITIETEEDISGLGVYLRFDDPDTQVEGERMWEELNAQAHTPLQFSTTIRFPKEGYFRVLADAHDPHRGLTVRDGFGVEITQLGATTTFGPMTPEPAPLERLDTPTPSSGSQAPPSSLEGTVADAPVQAQAKWEVITSQSFEGVFPSAGWTVQDLSNDGYERYWDNDDYRPFADSWAAWPANGGANGIDPAQGDHDYPNNMNTRMIVCK